MSDQGRDHRELPRRPRDIDHHYAAEEEERDRQNDRPAMATSTITLPPIQDQYGSYSSAPARGGYAPDPRAGNSYGTSPSSVNGYGPPSNQQPPYLPPLQPPGDPRSPTYPPPPRDDYYRQAPPPPPGGQYQEPYYSGYNRGPPPPPPPGYGAPGPYGPHHYEYPRGPGVPPQMPQATPRQRTSIACKYCRKRKIRCSGYQSAPGGKCVNCSRMGMECIFQPVSSSSSTAFIPVSALSNGVIPPGTQLFGAYGQPLPPAQQPYQPSSYPPPLQSPTTPYPPPYDNQDPNNAAGRGARRRARRSDEPEDVRLPPPNPSHPDDPRTRSPAEGSSHGSPPSHYYGPPGYEPHRGGPTHSPGGASTGPAPSPLSRGSTGYSYGGTEGSTPPPARSGANPPASGSSTSVMNLSNLVDNTSDIDRSMLGKLDRRNQK